MQGGVGSASQHPHFGVFLRGGWGLLPEAGWDIQGRTPKAGKSRLQGRWPPNDLGMAAGWAWGMAWICFWLYTAYYLGVSQISISASHLLSVSPMLEPPALIFHFFSHLYIDPLWLK